MATGVVLELVVSIASAARPEATATSAAPGSGGSVGGASGGSCGTVRSSSIVDWRVRTVHQMQMPSPCPYCRSGVPGDLPIFAVCWGVDIETVT